MRSRGFIEIVVIVIISVLIVSALFFYSLKIKPLTKSSNADNISPTAIKPGMISTGPSVAPNKGQEQFPDIWVIKNVEDNFEEMKNWKIYTDTEYSFTFKYPANKFQLAEDSEEVISNEGNIESIRNSFNELMGYPPPKFLNGLILTEKESKYSPTRIRIWVFENLANTSVQQWYEKNNYYPYSFGKQIKSITDGQRPIEFLLNDATGYFSYGFDDDILIYLPNKQVLFFIMVDEFGFYGGDGHKIVSTFKFL